MKIQTKLRSYEDFFSADRRNKLFKSGVAELRSFCNKSFLRVSVPPRSIFYALRAPSFLRIFALIFLLPSIALAGTPVSQDMAGQYYQNCIAKDAGLVSKKGQEAMCACTANTMMQSMSVEDIQMMGQQNQTGRKALNKMIIEVYAPCIDSPAYDYYNNTCIMNQQTQRLSNNPRELCACMADAIAKHLQQNSGRLFARILRQNPNIVDPMQALTEDPEFERFAQNKLIGCYTGNR